MAGSRKVIAVTGKGGTGKTALVSVLVKVLAGMGSVLAIDGDSAGGLQYTLGTTVSETIGDIRKNIIDNPSRRKEIENEHIRTVISGALTDGPNFKLMVMGRAEGPGCYCQVNELLKYGIESLSSKFDYVLIDCEAGPEQISRRILQKADVLLIMIDGSVRSIQVAKVISSLAKELLAKEFDKAGLVINRYKPEEDVVTRTVEQFGLDVLGYVPEDRDISDYDRTGRPLIELADTSPSVASVRELVQKLVS